MNYSLIKKREIFSVWVMVSIIGLMTLHGFRVSSKEVFEETSIISTAVQELVVNVDGAVERPGRYHFKKGTSLKEVFRTIQLLPEADVSRFNQAHTLKKSRTIHVPRKISKTKKKPSQAI